MIHMFCLYHFSLQCIIKKIIYRRTVPLIEFPVNNTSGESTFHGIYLKYCLRSSNPVLLLVGCGMARELLIVYISEFLKYLLWNWIISLLDIDIHIIIIFVMKHILF